MNEEGALLHGLTVCSARTLAGLVGAPACGDVMKLQIKVSDDGKIEEAVFKVCVFSLVLMFAERKRAL